MMSFFESRKKGYSADFISLINKNDKAEAEKAIDQCRSIKETINRH